MSSGIGEKAKTPLFFVTHCAPVLSLPRLHADRRLTFQPNAGASNANRKTTSRLSGTSLRDTPLWELQRRSHPIRGSHGVQNSQYREDHQGIEGVGNKVQRIDLISCEPPAYHPVEHR